MNGNAREILENRVAGAIYSNDPISGKLRMEEAMALVEAGNVKRLNELAEMWEPNQTSVGVQVERSRTIAQGYREAARAAARV